MISAIFLSQFLYILKPSTKQINFYIDIHFSPSCSRQSAPAGSFFFAKTMSSARIKIRAPPEMHLWISGAVLIFRLIGRMPAIEMQRQRNRDGALRTSSFLYHECPRSTPQACLGRCSVSEIEMAHCVFEIAHCGIEMRTADFLARRASTPSDSPSQTALLPAHPRSPALRR